jgi:ATP-dependent Clp protease, protease subunit
VKTTELFIYKNIGASWWSDGVTADQFRQEFQAAEKDSDIINIRINSPGGSLFDGIAIYNTIAQSKKEVNTYIDGIAYSMAAIIALAGKKVYMAENATLLLHCCSGVAVGNIRDMKNAINMMDALDKSMVITIANKTGLSEKEVQDKWMNYDDHTFTAKDAQSEKLVDELIPTHTKANIPANLSALSLEELFAFYSDDERTAPEKNSFFNKIVSQVREALAVKPKAENMNFEKLKSALTTVVDGKIALSPEDINALNSEMDAALKTGDIYTKADIDAAAQQNASELQAAQEKINELTAEVTALKAPSASAGNEPVKKEEEKPNASIKNDVSDAFETDFDREAQARYAKENA